MMFNNRSIIPIDCTSKILKHFFLWETKFSLNRKESKVFLFRAGIKKVMVHTMLAAMNQIKRSICMISQRTKLVITVSFVQRNNNMLYLIETVFDDEYKLATTTISSSVLSF